MSAQSLLAIQLAVDALGLIALALIVLKFFQESKRGPKPNPLHRICLTPCIPRQLLGTTSSRDSQPDEALLECAASADPLMPAAAELG